MDNVENRSEGRATATKRVPREDDNEAGFAGFKDASSIFHHFRLPEEFPSNRLLNSSKLMAPEGAFIE